MWGGHIPSVNFEEMLFRFSYLYTYAFPLTIGIEISCEKAIRNFLVSSVFVFVFSIHYKYYFAERFLTFLCLYSLYSSLDRRH